MGNGVKKKIYSTREYYIEILEIKKIFLLIYKVLVKNFVIFALILKIRELRLLNF